MRTVILVGCILISDGLFEIANKKEHEDETTTKFVAIILMVSILMDVVDFIHGF
jgi:hypothetical protein